MTVLAGAGAGAGAALPGTGALDASLAGVGLGTEVALAGPAGVVAGVFSAVEAFGNGLTRRLILTSVPSGFLTVTILNSPSDGCPLVGGLGWVVVLAVFVAWSAVVTGFAG